MGPVTAPLEEYRNEDYDVPPHAGEAPPAAQRAPVSPSSSSAQMASPVRTPHDSDSEESSQDGDDVADRENIIRERYNVGADGEPVDCENNDRIQRSWEYWRANDRKRGIRRAQRPNVKVGDWIGAYKGDGVRLYDLPYPNGTLITLTKKQKSLGRQTLFKVIEVQGRDCGINTG